MKILNFLIFSCFSAVCVEASAVLEVSGHVGGEVSLHCSGNWTTDNSSDYNLYFCRGFCFKENTLIQTERKNLTVKRRGRYSMRVNRQDGAFNITITRLKRTDAGRYHCGVGKTFNVLYREVNLIVLNAPTVPPGSVPFTSTLQTVAPTLPPGSSPSSTALSTTPPTAEEKTSQPAANTLTGTTVVIIVSMSLALLVCAIIPLIFYRHYRSNQGGQERLEGNRGDADCCEENADVAFTQSAMRLQSLEPDDDPESSAQDASQYADMYQALDPKSLD